MTYFIPENNLAEFERRMKLLVRRAVRCNSPLTYKIDRNIFEDREITFINAHGKETKRRLRFCQVEVEGDRPKFAGWSFLGTLEHTTEGNILRLVPGETAPAQYRDCAPTCDHCKINRVRKDTYLVRHDNGDHRQVGSGCIKDFLGAASPQQLASMTEAWVSFSDMIKMAEDYRWQGGGDGVYVSYERYDLIEYLSHVCAIIRVSGTFMSRSSSEKIFAANGNTRRPETTAWKAYRLGYIPPQGANKEDFHKWQEERAKFAPLDEDKEMAENAITWCLRKFGSGIAEDDVDDIKDSLLSTREQDSISDFDHNLLVIAKGQSCERRTFGIAAYLIQAYRKDNGLIPDRDKKPVSNHVGEVGKRFRNLRVTVNFHTSWDTAYGTQHLFKMVTAEGNIIVWKTNSFSLTEGEQYDLTATVKEHGQYNGEKQTTVSRAAVVDVPKTSPEPESVQAVQEMAVA
jgi:hypothetical protein